jgi:predicted transcriptional regulator
LPDFDWNAYGFVVGSEYRKKVINSLVNGPKTPKQISELTHLHLNHVSFTLSGLEDARTVVCLTPQLRKGKLFQLTKLGREIASKLQS